MVLGADGRRPGGGKVVAVAVALAAVALASCGAARPRAPAAPAIADRLAPAIADRFAPAALLADVAWLCDPARRGRGSATPDALAAAEHIAAEMADIGLEVVEQPLPGGGRNVIGILRGDDRAVLVTAHHDHLGMDAVGRVYPGADDNASGVAVMLALARDAADRRDGAGGSRSGYRHTLIFASFDAEEIGLLGSAEYLARPVWPLDRTIAVVNFDMVGRNFFEAGVDRPAAVAVIGLEDHAGARVVVEELAAVHGLSLIVAPARLLEVFGFAARTDDWRFRRQGLVAIHFSTGLHDDYHRPTDRPERLVPGQMACIGRTAAGLLRYLAEARVPKGAGKRSVGGRR
jgi:hypothetical protein